MGRFHRDDLFARRAHDDDDDKTLYRRSDPDTSRRAVRYGELGRVRCLVLSYYVKFLKSTDWAMDEWFNKHWKRRGVTDEHRLSTARSRRNELTYPASALHRRYGEFLEDTGLEQKQEGSKRAVWRLRPEKLEEAILLLKDAPPEWKVD